MVVLAALLVLALFAPMAAFIGFGVFVGAIILATMLGRWEHVMILAIDEDVGD
jgi:hypothetical protein